MFCRQKWSLAIIDGGIILDVCMLIDAFVFMESVQDRPSPLQLINYKLKQGALWKAPRESNQDSRSATRKKNPKTDLKSGFSERCRQVRG